MSSMPSATLDPFCEKSLGQLERCEKELWRLLPEMEDQKKWERYFCGFLKLYRSFLTLKMTPWEKIEPPPAEKIWRYHDLEDVSWEVAKRLLSSLVVVKLNGGLGTTMGCSFPKSLITVRNGQNFLDLTMNQLEDLNKRHESSVPLVLMDSFSTHSDTAKVIQKYSTCVTPIFTFLQSQYPRINGDSLMPVCATGGQDDHSNWYPPGHGNFFESFHESGLLQRFLDEGRHVAFISNVDNLGACVDLKILQQLVRSGGAAASSEIDCIMEVTDKTRSDVKGGTLVMCENQMRLLEVAQVPPEHVEDFKSVSKFRVFNTNNIWINLRSLKEKLLQDAMSLDLIINKKNLSNGLPVIQLETAIGASIKCFQNSIGVNVPRSRFLPVKSNSDLLLIMSNLYSLHNGCLLMNPLRQFQTTPLVQLSGSCFKTVKDFLSRFESIPDILELDHLTVSGDISFGKGVVLKGTVIIVAPHGHHIDIPRGAILENKILSGNLRIVDH